jgi:hypothetical protein
MEPHGRRVWIPASAGMTVWWGMREVSSPFVISAKAGSHGCGAPMGRANAGPIASVGPGFRRDDEREGARSASTPFIGPSGG